MRDLVTLSRDYYVAVNGDEGNTGTSAGSPWPIRYAIDHVCRNLDIQHACVTIHAAEPPSGQCYPPILLPNWFGNCSIDPGVVVNGIPAECYTAPRIIGGDYDHLSTYLIGSVSGQQPFAVCALGNSQPWFVSGFYDTGCDQAVLADKHGKLDLGDMLYGGNGTHVAAINGSFVEFLRGSRQRFFGSAQRFARALHGGSQIIAQNGSGSVGEASVEPVYTGAWPNFSHAFAYAHSNASIDLSAAFFSGTAYGTRAVATDSGYVYMPAGVLPHLS